MARFLIPKSPGLYDYGAKALDGDADKIAYEEPAPPELEFFDPRRVFGGGARVSSANMPTKLLIKGRKREIPDFSNELHMFLVNQRFIDIVEDFQAEIQAFPIECVWKDGSSAGSFFFFFTTILLDAVVREKTTATWFPHSRGGFWEPRAGETFVFDKGRIGGAHFWVDPNMPMKCPLISEELFSALKRANIRLFENAQRFDEE